MINVNNLCPQCMNIYENMNEPCPYCGYDHKTIIHDNSALEPFQILNGHYLIGNKIGFGGFGIIYIAMDLIEEKPVAIKEFFPFSLAHRVDNEIVPSSIENRSIFRAAKLSFRKEAQLLERFQDVNHILRFHQFFEENSTSYIVTDYVSGMNLKEYMKKKKQTFSEEESIRLMTPILEALAVMHAEHVIHRDISPENLILSPNNELTLIDFGAAREFTENLDDNLTVILKRGYAPEEQYHYGSHQGAWTDVYACCAVLYQMVSGILPQEADKRQEKDNLKPLDELEYINVSERFARVIETGMNLDTSRRYASMQILLKELHNLTIPEPVITPEPVETPELVETPEPVITPEPVETPEPVITPAPIVTPEPIAKPKQEFYSQPRVPSSGTHNKFLDKNMKTAVAAIVVLCLLGFFMFANRKIDVPNVADTAILTAEDTLTNAGFKYQLTYENSEEFPKDWVISQDITGKAAKGSTITLTVSSGPETGYLDDVTNMSEEDAIEHYKSEGFENISVNYQFDETAEKGTVISVEVDSSDTDNENSSFFGDNATNNWAEYSLTSAITLNVCDYAEVPSLKGLTASEASEIVQNCGLTYTEISHDKKYYSTTYKKGQIARQSLKAGKRVEKNSEIRCLVCDGTVGSNKLNVSFSKNITLKAGSNKSVTRKVRLSGMTAGNSYNVYWSIFKLSSNNEYPYVEWSSKTWENNTLPLKITAPSEKGTYILQVYGYNAKNENKPLDVEHITVTIK